MAIQVSTNAGANDDLVCNLTVEMLALERLLLTVMKSY